MSVILEPGVRAVDVDEAEADAVDEVELRACRLAEDDDEADVMEALDDAVTCCPVGNNEGTFKLVGADEANISTESTLNDEDDDAKLSAVVLDVG